MLNEKYNEYALLEEKRLLRELLNVETDAEIKAAIVADMTKFTTEIGQNYDTFIANQKPEFSKTPVSATRHCRAANTGVKLTRHL